MGASAALISALGRLDLPNRLFEGSPSLVTDDVLRDELEAFRWRLLIHPVLNVQLRAAGLNRLLVHLVFPFVVAEERRSVPHLRPVTLVLRLQHLRHRGVQLQAALVLSKQLVTVGQVLDRLPVPDLVRPIPPFDEGRVRLLLNRLS